MKAYFANKKRSIYLILACIIVFDVFYLLYSVNQSTLAQEQEINDIWLRLPISSQCRIISYEIKRPIFSYELIVICDVNVESNTVNENMKKYFGETYLRRADSQGRQYIGKGSENGYVISFYNFENTNKWRVYITKDPNQDKVRALGF